MGIQQDLKRLIKMACESDCTVLVTGATGTGKTSLARQIHDQSKRRGKSFVAVNMATLHEGVLESELFGHEKGAFTGADLRKVGRLEIAQGGTVFLDEVGELSLRLQARLLEFLQSKTVVPVGGSREVRLDVRVIAATHKNLDQAVLKGDFREDLFHRLRVISIPLKSLNGRMDEFDEILQACFREIAIREKRPLLQISAKVLEQFKRYVWSGNIRELRNVLEYAVLACEGTEITSEDLPTWFFQSLTQQNEEISCKQTPVLGVAEVPMTLDYQNTLERLDREYLSRALSRNGGRINRTARQIGLNKATLIRRLRAYGLNSSLKMKAVEEK